MSGEAHSPALLSATNFKRVVLHLPEQLGEAHLIVEVVVISKTDET